MSIPREMWTDLQRAETMLVHAGQCQRREQAGHLMDEAPVEGADRVYLTRLASGFDPRAIRPGDYLVRYPFSSITDITAVLERLRAAGVVAAAPGDAYALTSSGRHAVEAWLHRVGALLDGLGEQVLDERQVERLIGFDHRILKAMAQPSSFPTPIFDCRRHGLQPPYDPPRLWHHWQLAWSMIACHEDAEQHVRRTRGIDPLTWFLRRQLWFAPRRPWRVRLTGSTLHAVASRYAPVSETACHAAWETLIEWGHAAGTYEEPTITAAGLAAHDADEQAIDDLFLNCWPSLDGRELHELAGLVATLNRHLDALAASEEPGR